MISPTPDGWYVSGQAVELKERPDGTWLAVTREQPHIFDTGETRLKALEDLEDRRRVLRG